MRGACGQLLVIQAEVEASQLQVVEVATLAPLCEGAELRADHLGRVEREHVSLAAPPSGVDAQRSSFEGEQRLDLVDVDLDLDVGGRSPSCRIESQPDLKFPVL